MFRPFSHVVTFVFPRDISRGLTSSPSTKKAPPLAGRALLALPVPFRHPWRRGRRFIALLPHHITALARQSRTRRGWAVRRVVGPFGSQNVGHTKRKHPREGFRRSRDGARARDAAVSAHEGVASAFQSDAEGDVVVGDACVGREVCIGVWEGCVAILVSVSIVLDIL